MLRVVGESLSMRLQPIIPDLLDCLYWGNRGLLNQAAGLAGYSKIVIEINCQIYSDTEILTN